MPKYFNNFPKLAYTNPQATTIVTDILTRVALVKGAIDNTSIYYHYDIQDGDTPEMIASKYYNDPELHWVVLIFNNIIDPFYDWPLSYQQFIKHLTDKYGSIPTAQSQIHHYEKIVETTDGYSGETTTKIYQIDQTAYNALVPSTVNTTVGGFSVSIVTSKRIIYTYDYELELNESKRRINLVRRELINEVKKQFIELMSA